MKHYHKNPRQITRKQFGDLKKWLAQLGDLGGIVHNLPTDEMIGGNQRARVFNINDCEVVVEHELDEPDEQGTVGLGYVIWEGHRYSYRQVVWDEKTCEQANIVANKAGGTFDWDILANQWEVPELLEWGFDERDLQLDWGRDEPAEAEQREQARQTLAERFVVPPFSVLDARQGYWQERKRAWIALGIESEVGRGTNLTDMSATIAGITDDEDRAAWNKRRRELHRGGRKGYARCFGQDLMRGEHTVGE